jgi:hypothetical protein
VSRDEDRWARHVALKEALTDAPRRDEVCTCNHGVDDHWPREGCVRRGCVCWWWVV